MSREVRRVPKDWQHPYRFLDCTREPKSPRISLIPLHDGFGEREQQWFEERGMWEKGYRRSHSKDGPEWVKHGYDYSYEEYGGERPDQKDYMPDWPESQRTHIQMYETVTEGTPISPVMETSEELAHWLADNGASSFGYAPAKYEQWLKMIEGSGWAPSMIVDSKGVHGGVQFMAGNP